MADDKKTDDKKTDEAAEAKKPKGKTDEARIQEACKAYGVDPKYLMGASVYGEEVVLVTVGGAKVRYVPGKPAPQLSAIAVTGVNPEAAKRKPITGAGAKK